MMGFHAVAMALLIGAIAPTQAHFGALTGGGCEGDAGGVVDKGVKTAGKVEAFKLGLAHKALGGVLGGGGAGGVVGLVGGGGGGFKGGDLKGGAGNIAKNAGDATGGADSLAENDGYSSDVAEGAGDSSKGSNGPKQHSGNFGHKTHSNGKHEVDLGSEDNSSGGSTNSHESQSSQTGGTESVDSSSGSENENTGARDHKRQTAESGGTEGVESSGSTEVSSSHHEKQSAAQESETDNYEKHQSQFKDKTSKSGSRDTSSGSEDNSGGAGESQTTEAGGTGGSSGGAVSGESSSDLEKHSSEHESETDDTEKYKTSVRGKSSDLGSRDASSQSEDNNGGASDQGSQSTEGGSSGHGAGKKRRGWDLKPYECCIEKKWGGWFDNYHGDDKGVSNVIQNVVQDILGWKKPNHINILVGFVIKCGLTVQRVIDEIIYGLGTSLWKLIAAVLQLSVCTTEGLFDFLFGSGYKAKICSVGCAPHYGLGGGLSHDEIITVLDEGWKECYVHWKKINKGKGWKGTSGLIEIVLRMIEDILGVGKQCKEQRGVSIGLFTKLWSRLTIFITGCAKHYGHDRNLIPHLETIFGGFGKHGYDCNEIRKYSSGCGKGYGLFHLKNIYHK